MIDTDVLMKHLFRSEFSNDVVDFLFLAWRIEERAQEGVPDNALPEERREAEASVLSAHEELRQLPVQFGWILMEEMLDPGEDGYWKIGLDDSPTKRYGRHVEAANVHHDFTADPGVLAGCGCHSHRPASGWQTNAEMYGSWLAWSTLPFEPPAHLLLCEGFVNVASFLIAGLGVHPATLLRKHELPSPLAVSIGILTGTILSPLGKQTASSGGNPEDLAYATPSAQYAVSQARAGRRLTALRG